MKRNSMSSFNGVFWMAFVVVCIAVTGAANAQRPSLSSLQAQINDLQAQINNLSVHSLDASDGDPVNVVTVDDNGRVGVDAAATDYSLTVMGKNADGRALRVRSAYAAHSVPADAPVLLVENDIHVELFRIQENGDIAIGVPDMIHIYENALVRIGAGRLFALGQNGDGQALKVRSAGGYNTVPPDAPVFLVADDADAELFKIQENGVVDVSGSTRTEILEITGGSDIAEPFPTEDGAEIPNGALLVIDETNPGHLKLSKRPYDQRVAGVVSGAGGMQPGLTLTQEEVFKNGRHVALTGRVYALADASNGQIEPGDLLTTSPTPGHAMKATNRERSHGAVIGKAMSSLESGRGLVLVLVNLQ